MKQYKSRSLPIEEFLLLLEEEYLSALIRVEIYPNEKDKSFHTSVAAGKKRKILDISRKNTHLETIFSSEEKMSNVKRKVLGLSYPNFRYSPKEMEKGFPYKGALVECSFVDDEGRDGIINGIAERVDFDAKQTYVKVGIFEELSFPSSDVRKLTQKEADRFYYYLPHSEFELVINDKQYGGILTSVHHDSGLVYLKREGFGTSYPYLINSVKRKIKI